MLSRYVVSQVKHNSYFLVGLGLGLWLALVTVPLEEEVACESAAPFVVSDDFEPQREERPLGPAGQSGRSVQRPRYYSTELGMRGGLLAGVLSSEDALETRAAALNQTAARLQPALRFFITASALQASPGRANVVGFTDTREMLKPFHALKYLADNYLEEYDFFFLVSDTSYVNARRLTELVSKLSVSQDIYMGVVSDDDTHYCTLEGGILMSNSVLRAVHGELDWCVRNSYSPQHHENIGRCVLHAAHQRCAAAAQGQRYSAVRLQTDRAPAAPAPPALALAPALGPALADAAVAFPALHPDRFYQLHAFVSRVYLERARVQARATRGAAWLSAGRHPRGFRNRTWPPALRTDAGLAPPPPPNRFDHLRWTRFNATHALLQEEGRAASALAGASAAAVRRLVAQAREWAARRWGAPAAAVRLEEGAWCWEPPRALRYRLLLRLGAGGALLQVEAARPLGAARLAPARYVTESARVRLVAWCRLREARAAAAFLRRYEVVCLQRDGNTELTLVIVSEADDPPSPQEEAEAGGLREAARALADAHRGAEVATVEARAEGGRRGRGRAAAQAAALAAALPRLAHDALVLLLDTRLDFNEDFLNRVRMNTIGGEQWFAPLPFARYVQAPPAAGAAPPAPAPPAPPPPGAPPAPPSPPARPALDAGLFHTAAVHALAFYRSDYEAARESWRGAEEASPAALLAAAGLRALRAPEPALLLAPPAPPCGLAPLERARDRSGDQSADGWGEQARCLRQHWGELLLGARHSLAKLLLQSQAALA